ncbi:putative protein FAM47C [Etheostoma cragini]|uniref:putative protein FAM47C n=1 Tax=Etheostoma cragini TaxID=417921 RepID=UPI00155EFD04|nr:putative protein FAM47C [Etheostoma cragini]
METKNTRTIFPWYKERLQTKYHKAPANKMAVIGSVSSVLSGERGVSPVIFHDTPNQKSSITSQKHKKCISKEHACFSKQMTQKQIRREYVAAVEAKLKQHPLAMYPHYKDHLTPDLFDKVLSVLYPDMSVNSASALPTLTGDDVEVEDEEEPSLEEVNWQKQVNWQFDV